MIDNRIIIVCWFNSHKDTYNPNCIQIVEDTFCNLGYEVEEFPFMQLQRDDKNYMETFQNKINEFDPKFIIFWNWANISYDELRILKNDNFERIFAIYNWDDPHCWLKDQRKIKFFDISYSTCMQTLHRYTDLGVKISKYLLPGFSPLTHYYDEHGDYECDVSFMCTNLYERGKGDHDKNILVDRLSMVRALDRDPRFKFNLYGPDRIKFAAPNSYKGPIPYEIDRLVFSNSKVNINVHGAFGDGYLNERTITILGSRGLMLVDPVPGLDKVLEPDSECIVMKDTDPQKIADQVYEIVSNYDKYKRIKDNGHNIAKKRFTYDVWTETILDGFKEYNKNYNVHKNINKLPLVFGIHIDGGNIVKIKDLIRLRSNIIKIDPTSKISWNLTHKFIKGKYSYVSSALTVITSYIDKYGDSLGLGFGFLNHTHSVEDVQNIIGEFDSRLCEMLHVKYIPDKLFRNIPDRYKPKSVLSYNISQYQIRWIERNCNIKAFMSWTATQTNVDGFSGSGTLLSPYYPHKDNPMIPATEEKDRLDCIMLNTITVDPIGCKYTNGESRWTIHPADPLTGGESQKMVIRRYLSNRYIDRNSSNYLSLFFDSNWVLNDGNLGLAWDNIMKFIGDIGLNFKSIDEFCHEYMECVKNNGKISFSLELNGLGFTKGEFNSSKDEHYIWTEDNKKRIIYKKNKPCDYDNFILMNEYDVIDFTFYQDCENITNIKPLEQVNDVSHITGRNYKLNKDQPLTLEEIDMANYTLHKLGSS